MTPLSAAVALSLAASLLVGCASASDRVRVEPVSQGPEQIAADRAACEAEAGEASGGASRQILDAMARLGLALGAIATSPVLGGPTPDDLGLGSDLTPRERKAVIAYATCMARRGYVIGGLKGAR